MRLDEIRNQFKNQSLNVLVPSSIKAVGGRVFPDQPAVVDLEAFKSVVQSWQGVHVPTYGDAIIAGTGGVVSQGGAGELLQATANQVYRVQSIHLSNAGGAPIVAEVTLGGAPVTSTTTGIIGPTESTLILGPFFADLNLQLAVSVVSGTASDLSTKVVYGLAVQ